MKIDCTEIQSIEKIENSLHSLAPYVGKIRPELARLLVSRYAIPGKTIYDPFCGSGSILLEGWHEGFTVLGSDLNKYAYIITLAKLNPPTNLKEAMNKLSKYNTTINESEAVSLSQNNPEWVCDFFHPRTLIEINKWVNILYEKDEWYLLACLLGILHHQRPGFLSYPSSHGAPYLRNKKYPREIYPEMYEYKNVYDKLQAKVGRGLSHLPTFDYSLLRNVYNCDNLCIDLSNYQIGTIITSPPYMKALSYARDNRMRLHFLGIEDWKNLDKKISPRKTDFIDLMIQSFDKWSKVQIEGDICILIIGEIIINYEKIKMPLLEFIINISGKWYNLKDVFIDPIPESKKVVKGNTKIAKENIIILERK